MPYLLILLVFLLSSCSTKFEEYYLIRVIDGDSLLVGNQACLNSADKHLRCEKHEVRIIGLDAPEYSQDPWGKKAYSYLKTLLSHGDIVKLEFSSQRFDKYGRFLSFVFLENTSFVNEKILENGFAEIFVLNKNIPYLNRLKLAQAKAKKLKLNIWQEQGGLTMSPYEYRNKHMKK